MNSTSIQLWLIAFCIWTLLSVSALWGDPPSRVGRLNFVNGTVSFRTESVDEWAPATLNYPLTIGDHLWTDQDGQAEVHIGSTAIRLASNTEISFLNLNDQTIQIRLSTGSMNLRLRHLAPTEEIELDTPNSSLSLLRAGTYRIDVQETGDTTVTVREGEVEVTAGSSVFPLRLRQTVAITGLDSPGHQVTDALPLDDWDQWCLARDQKENQLASAKYVPRDEVNGVEDLDQYGSWSQDADLGPVWAPTVVVVGWAPYRFGHWVWVDLWGWTWIDEAPWGFAPFHYGRWAFRRSAWVWVPGAYLIRPVYAPALVTFVGGGGWRSSMAPGGSIGWFPLGPHEPYIAPYRTNRTRLHDVEVEHEYVNRDVPGAVTCVPNEVFTGGRPANRSALLLSRNELFGAPVRGALAPLVPRRESILGSSPGTGGPIARPPASVMSRPVMARRTPPPPTVSFAAHEQALAAHPGQPLDPATLSNLGRSAPAVRAPVSVVTPGYPRKSAEQPSFSPQTRAGNGRPSVIRRGEGPVDNPSLSPPRSPRRDVVPRQSAPGDAGTATPPPRQQERNRQPRFSPVAPQAESPLIPGDERGKQTPATGGNRPPGKVQQRGGSVDDDLLLPGRTAQ